MTYPQSMVGNKNKENCIPLTPVSQHEGGMRRGILSWTCFSVYFLVHLMREKK